MDFHFTPEEEAFRAEVRAFLDENLPPGTNTNDPSFIAEWNRKAREKRWIGFSWPKEVGGQGYANADVVFALTEGGGTIHTKAQITGTAASMGEGVVSCVLDALVTDFSGKLAAL